MNKIIPKNLHLFLTFIIYIITRKKKLTLHILNENFHVQTPRREFTIKKYYSRASIIYHLSERRLIERQSSESTYI